MVGYQFFFCFLRGRGGGRGGEGGGGGRVVVGDRIRHTQ